MPRKSKPAAEQKKSVVFIRVTEDQKRQIDNHAQNEGLETATWARYILLKELKRGNNGK